MAGTGKKKGGGQGKGRDGQGRSAPPRPAIDLAQIKTRYSARPLGPPGEGQGAGEDTEPQPGGIEFIEAETLSHEELEEELEAQAEADIQGEETGFSGEALSLFDEEDKPPKKKRKRRKKRKPAQQEEGGLDFVDLSKPRPKEAAAKGALDKAILLCAVVLMLSILLTLYYWLLIDRIEVTGNETLERAEVLTESGINVGEHMFLINLRDARKKLLENPRIKAVRIQRVYPDRLVIAIEERKPLAAIAGGGSYAIIDQEGYVLTISGETGGLLEVYGLGSAGFQLNERLGETDDYNSSILLRMVQALDQAGVVEDMVSLDMTQPLSINLQSREGYTIHVGQAEDLEEKLDHLPLVLAKVQAMGYTGGTIDLAVRGDPVYTPPRAAATGPGEELPSQPEDPADGPAAPGGGPEGPKDGPAPSPSPTPDAAPTQPLVTPGGSNFSG